MDHSDPLEAPLDSVPRFSRVDSAHQWIKRVHEWSRSLPRVEKANDIPPAHTVMGAISVEIVRFAPGRVRRGELHIHTHTHTHEPIHRISTYDIG